MSFSVLIVVPAKNEEKYIGATVNSILDQRLNAKTVIFLVDDGSTDRTYEIMKLFEKEHDNVVALTTRRYGTRTYSIGAVLAINYAVRTAGEVFGKNWKYLVLVDADTILLQNYLATTIGTMEKHPHCGICGGMIINEPQRSYVVPGTGMVIRRDVWYRTGGFKPYPTPDTFLQLKAISMGWKVCLARNAKMMLLRKTGTGEGLVKVYYSRGVSDGMLGFTPIYAVLRGVFSAIMQREGQILVKYLSGFWRGSRLGRSVDQDIRSMARIFEKFRMRQLILSFVGSSLKS